MGSLKYLHMKNEQRARGRRMRRSGMRAAAPGFIFLSGFAENPCRVFSAKFML
jgi:hypothetical protein